MRRSSIGFDRRIDVEWLDAAAGQVVAGASPDQVREYLWGLLDGVVAGEKSNSARGKTITVLSHIWSQVPEPAVGLRQRAREQLQRADGDQRLAIHWAMMLGTYPFFADVSSAAGRLLALQGEFSLALITRRLVDSWGERSTLARAAQRIIRSMVQWGVLTDTDAPGIYKASGVMRAAATEVAELLVEALLIDSEHETMPLGQLVGHPAAFPFDLKVSGVDLRRGDQFRVDRLGLDADMVGLAPAPATSFTDKQGRLWR
jgi:hypothetical protein